MEYLEPKPCPNPNCRDSDPVVELVRGWAGISPRRVECQCGAHGPSASSDGAAIEKWNAPEFRDHFSPEPFLGMFEGPMGLVNRYPRVRDPIIAMAAALTAAISLLERGGKKAAPSDRMFEQMLADYQRALDDGRRAIWGNEIDG